MSLRFLSIANSELKIKLVNLWNNKAGRVEIFHPAFGWGTVCGYDWTDSSWSNTASDVVCRQLGFTGASATRYNAYYGRGTGFILLDRVVCTGNETYIWDCQHRGWNVNYCSHS